MLGIVVEKPPFLLGFCKDGWTFEKKYRYSLGKRMIMLDACVRGTIGSMKHRR